MRLSRSVILTFLVLFIPSIIVTGIGTAIYGKAEIKQQVDRRVLREASNVDIGSLAIREVLHSIAADITYLSNLPKFKAMLDTPTPENLNALSHTLSNFMDTYGIYDQVRWIDFSGMERLRLNFDRQKGRSWVVPESELTDKSNRYYFLNAITLAPRSIYLSAFDLNVEHNAIEIPIKPTLRLATPALDNEGQRKGVIVINYLGDNLLSSFTASSQQMHTDLMLLNGDGFWLRSPDPSQEWGFMYNRPDQRFGVSHPEAWNQIQSVNSGQIMLEDGLWTWRRIFPIDEIKESGRFQGITRVTPDPDHKDNIVWSIVSHIPEPEISRIAWGVWTGLAVPFSLFTMILAVGCGGLARFHNRIEVLNQDLARRAKDAEAAGNAKASFLANMSHEIRTPMNAVLGLAYLLQQRPLKAEEKDLVNKIGIAGRSLLSIINDILDFSKIEAGRLEIEQARFRLQDVLDNVGAIMAAAACDKDIELVVGAAPVKGTHLIGDPARLQQILVNLTGNAIKFTEKGEISLQVQVVETDGDGNTTLRFSVRDTGIGIPEDKQQQIFSTFSQADMTTARRFGGTGLGLSISRHLVQLMGGTIGVNSHLGEGSEFWFTISFQSVDDQGYAVPNLAHLSLLVVDDHTIARESMAEIIKGLGWDVDCAASGQVAVRMYRERLEAGRPYDVVMTDWRMPGMNGIETGKTIRQLSGTTFPPIIIMVSAYARDMLLTQPDASVADVIINKPVTASCAYNAIAEAKQLQAGGLTMSPNLGQKGERLQDLVILVVDDSAINCEVVRRILESEGAKVTIANDGNQTLDLLKRHADRFDAVLMDVQMPGLDGYETTGRIRHELKMQSLPVIALTAGAFQSQQQAALAAGMDDFIAKPFEVEEMIAILVRLCKRHPGADSHPEPLPVRTPANAAPPLFEEQKAMANWRDRDALHRYLRYFSLNYSNAAERVQQLLVTRQAHGLASLVHKMKGAAGNLALTHLHVQASRLDEALHQDDPGLEPLVDGFLRSLAETLVEIKAVTRETAQGNSADFVTNLNAAADMLNELMSALATDNPDECDPILAALGSVVPQPMLDPIALQLAAFDFRAAETEVKALQVRLGTSSEGIDP